MGANADVTISQRADAISDNGDGYPSAFTNCLENNNIAGAKAKESSSAYLIENNLLRYDTSMLGTITGVNVSTATLKQGIGAIVNTDSRDFTGEYFAWTQCQASSFSLACNTTAWDVGVGTLTGSSLNTFTLANAGANINKTGFTGFRECISGGQPTGVNQITEQAVNGNASAWLEVDYCQNPTAGPSPTATATSNTPTVTATRTNTPAATATVTVTATNTPLTANFDVVTRGANDSDCVYLAQFGLSYPPAPPTDLVEGGVVLGSRGFFAGTTYVIGMGGLLWDTSTLGATVTLVSAALEVETWLGSIGNADSRNLVGAWYLPPPVSWSTADYTSTSTTTAITGVSLSTFITGSSYDLTLANVNTTNINPVGHTAMRLWVDGGQPTGDNNVDFNCESPAPRLIVRYYP